MKPENNPPRFGGIEAADPATLEQPVLAWTGVTSTEQLVHGISYQHGLLAGRLLVEREHARQEATLEHYNATTDSLTGLLNRRGFIEAAQKTLSVAKPTDRFVVLFADLDEFKAVNDRLGHDIGDDLLHAIGNVMQSSFPESVIARFGGDEFTILHRIDCSEVLDITDHSQRHTETVIETIKQRCIARSQEIPGISEVGVSVTIGKSSVHRASQAGLLWEMLGEADDQMLKDKPDRPSSVRRRG